MIKRWFIDADRIGDAFLECVPTIEFHPSEEVIVVFRRKECLPAHAESHRQFRTNLPIVIDEQGETIKIWAEIDSLILSSLRVESDVGLPEGIIKRKIEEVVEGELRAREDIGKERPALPGIVFGVPSPELETMVTTV